MKGDDDMDTDPGSNPHACLKLNMTLKGGEIHEHNYKTSIKTKAQYCGLYNFLCHSITTLSYFK